MSRVSSSPLQRLLVERIAQKGPLTFAEYMRAALYEPEYGYYTSGVERIGWSGDYFTSTDVSALFAHCLGRQLYQFWEKLKCPAPFSVLEQGAGRGDLAAGVRIWAEREAAEFAEALDYQTRDISGGEDSLRPTSSARVHVLLSNELLDAFPVHVVEVREGQLYEVFVGCSEDGHLREELAAPSSPALEGYLDSYRIPWRDFPPGWRAEINLDALLWLEQATSLLQAHGFILAIDYGEKARDLYVRERRNGTLLCYYRHSISERPLRLPGEQDITAHVNFSALIAHGRLLGLRLHKYTLQRLWLAERGLRAELEQRRARDFSLAESQRASDAGQIALLEWYNLRQRAAILTDPAGMGNFKVLILRR